MKKYARAALVAVSCLLAVVVISACGSKASVVATNLSRQADNFQIDRTIYFYNGITGQVVMEIEGLCSIGQGYGSTNPPTNGGTLAVTCQVNPGAATPRYIKDFLGLSNNVTYFVKQNYAVHVSDAHYLVIWRPSTLIPSIHVQ